MKHLKIEMEARTFYNGDVVVDRWPAIEWKKSFAEIAEDRTKHFAKKTEIAAGSEAYQRLARISMNEPEVEDWARRSFAPERIRNSWFTGSVHHKVEDDGVASAEPAEVTTNEKLLAENEALREKLARFEQNSRTAPRVK